MRIKRVEIIGFKSFCDRAVIHIDTSVTGVVGPNGCGKSNIVDAIRWCMGEQSAKHLRGKAMEDVIFSGSESRGPAPMAEVSLTFDDVGFSHETLEMALHSDEAAAAEVLDRIAGEGEAEADAGADAVADGAAEGAVAEGAARRRAAAEARSPTARPPRARPPTARPARAQSRAAPEPMLDEHGQPVASASEEVRDFLTDRPPALDFARYTEVTISRRLYRDGTSQYFINKTPCRLRDITDFFLGTGAGTKAYSIIEQGRIGQIVSSRPQDRRAIIEEAAGITKFKAKKKAAERKLDQTRQNLLRVSDIVVELDKRMGTLRRQAQKAERYRKYKAEMKDIELWKATHRFLELRAEDGLVRGRLGVARVELEDDRAELEARDGKVVAERADMAVEERRLAGLQEQVYELDNRIRLAESKIGFQSREADELEQRITAGEAEIAELERRREEAAAQHARQAAELAELEAEAAVGDGEVAAREAELAEAREVMAGAQRRLDEARAQLSVARADVSRGEAQREALVRRREEAQRRLERVREETEVAHDRLREHEREGKRVDAALAELRQTRLDLGSQAEHFEARQAHLAEEVSRGETEVETLRTEAHRRRSRLQSLIEIQERYEGFARGTRTVMQRSSEIEGAIRGLVADVVRAPEQLEVAVEAALGDRLGGVLVEDAQVGVAAIGYLKRTNAGRSAFVPCDPPTRMSASAGGGLEAATAAPSPTFVAVDLAPAAEGAAPDEAVDPVVGPAVADAAVVAEGAAPGDAEPDTGTDVASPLPWGATVDTGWSDGTGIQVEDRTQVVAASAALGGEGVLGRMVDLVQLDDRYRALAPRLFGDCLVVDSLERAVALHRQGVTDTLVTLDGDVVDGRGVVAGGSRDAQGSGVLAQKREIRDLEEIVASLDSDLTEATARLVAAKGELKQVQKALEGLRGQAHEGDIAIMGHEKDATRHRHELDRLRERLNQLGGEQGELDERLSGLDAEDAALAARTVDAADRIDRFEKAQLGEIEGVTTGRERVDVLAASLTEARVRAAQLGEKRAAADAGRLRAEATERDLAARVERLRTGIVEGAERAGTLRADCAELEGELAGQRERRHVAATELDEGRDAYERRLAELTTSEMAVRELRGRADRLAQEVAHLEVKLAGLDSSRQVLLETIWDRYQVNVPEIIYDHHLRPVAGEPEDARLHELKDLVERMGTDINLTAIEEYAEVSKRFEFLSSQKVDLEDAVDQLQRAIDKINKTSRKLFRDTFAAVNAKFKEVFPRLFRGGQAHLSLTGGDDVDLLEAGVEIMAQPPGKKNSTVDQLSGGEKALTAVALIFSIFLIKPSPFCILDEVDAPLDEANVDRYNEIVREMTDRSQFVIITHNKRTMESADNLYGVTMQEPGVSKLVTVNLSRVGEHRPAAATA
ncbi:MAG: chromosome segregation protein SMC [Kofleriaceae bacterium]|nr:chromosome segregation protein SMC [Kofleriaceae bacterium]